jgi:hypothetical protein
MLSSDRSRDRKLEEDEPFSNFSSPYELEKSKIPWQSSKKELKLNIVSSFSSKQGKILDNCFAESFYKRGIDWSSLYLIPRGRKVGILCRPTYLHYLG